VSDWAEVAYGDLVERRDGDVPYVVVNMVASVDGAISIEGRTSKLGGPSDGHLFHYLRSLADVILVGAQTVRAEHYGPPKVREQWVGQRAARGQPAQPRLAIVTRSLDLDWDSRLFTAGHRPVIVAPASAHAERLAKARSQAEVVIAGDEGVDLEAALDHLGGHGAVVLCEGGPTLNGELARDDLIDELCVTVAPVLVGGNRVGLVGTSFLPEPRRMEAISSMERDGDLFLRFRREGR
jgi:riboflavin-specific deaminase-like protein